MTLFALYHRWRTWHESDNYVVAIIVILLLLLVIFNRFKSFLANGVFIGCVIGCLIAFSSGENTYFKKMGHIESGILLGLIVGGLAKMIFAFARNRDRQPLDRPTPTKIDHSHGAVFWASALAISGISVGLTLALFFKMTYHETALLMGGLLLTGLLFGFAAGPFSKRTPWIQASLELWICITLGTGIGAIIGWKFVLPFLMFDVNPAVSTNVLFRVATYSCAAVGGLIGLIAWALRNIWRRGEKSGIMSSN